MSRYALATLLAGFLAATAIAQTPATASGSTSGSATVQPTTTTSPQSTTVQGGYQATPYGYNGQVMQSGYNQPNQGMYNHSGIM